MIFGVLCGNDPVDSHFLRNSNPGTAILTPYWVARNMPRPRRGCSGDTPFGAGIRLSLLYLLYEEIVTIVFILEGRFLDPTAGHLPVNSADCWLAILFLVFSFLRGSNGVGKFIRVPQEIGDAILRKRWGHFPVKSGKFRPNLRYRMVRI